jgi:hypothetical protein
MRCGSFLRNVIDLALVASEDFRVVDVTFHKSTYLPLAGDFERNGRFSTVGP